MYDTLDWIDIFDAYTFNPDQLYATFTYKCKHKPYKGCYSITARYCNQS